MRIIHEALTFDDVLLEPAYSEILPREVQLKTQLTRSLTLRRAPSGPISTPAAMCAPSSAGVRHRASSKGTGRSLPSSQTIGFPDWGSRRK